MKHLLSLIIAVALLAACSEPTPDPRLLRAESLIDSLPDTALAIIESIDTSRLHGERNAALHGLLLTQARHKNDIIETDDSLINASLRFFNSNGPDQKTMLAHFYRATLNYHAGHYDTAVVENLKALSIAKTLDDDYWKARTYEQIADNYFVCYNSRGAIPYYDSAQVFYQASGHKLNQLYSQLELSLALGFNKRVDAAIAVLDSMDIGEYSNDSVFMGLRHDYYVGPYIRKKQYGLALAHFSASQNYLNGRYPWLVGWDEVSRLYSAIGCRDSAWHYLEKSKSLGESPERLGAIERSEYHYYKNFGDKEKAFEALELSVRKDDQLTTQCLESNLAFLEKEFYTKQMLEKQYEIKKKAFVWEVVCILLLVTAGVSIGIVWRKARRKRRELVLLITQKDAFEQSVQEETARGKRLEQQIEQSKEHIVSLEAALKESRQAADSEKRLFEESSARVVMLEAEMEVREATAYHERVELESQLKQRLESEEKWQHNASRLLELRGNLIDGLAAEVFFSGDKSTGKIYHLVQDELAKFKSDEMRHELEQLVDDCNGGVITRMRSELPSFKDKHIWFVVLKISGFSMRTICILADITIGNYYNYWSRRRARIEASDAPSKDEFMEMLKPKG